MLIATVPGHQQLDGIQPTARDSARVVAPHLRLASVRGQQQATVSKASAVRWWRQTPPPPTYSGSADVTTE